MGHQSCDDAPASLSVDVLVSMWCEVSGSDWSFLQPDGWEGRQSAGTGWTAEVQRLPLGTLLGAGEFFGSWVDRLAEENCLSRTGMWVALGLTQSSQSQPIAYGVTLDSRQLATVALASGEPVDAIEASLLATFATTAVPLDGLDLSRPDTVRHWSAASWAYVWQSHACPQCLKGNDGAWQLTWKLPWSYMCLAHGTYLIGACPDCGFRLQSTVKDARQRRACVGSTQGEVSPRASGDQRYRRGEDDICGKLVINMRAQPVGDVAAANVQTDLLNLLNPHAALAPHLSSVLEQTRRSPADAFRDLRSIVKLALHIGSPALLADADGAVRDAFERHCRTRDEMVPRRGAQAVMSNRAYRRPPTDPLLAAGALRIAHPLALGEPSVVREAAEKLVEAAEELPAGRDRWWHVLKFLTPPDCMTQELRRARDHVTFAGLADFDGRALRRHAAPAIVARAADLVPGICWPEVYEHFAPLMPQRGWPEAGPRYVTINLVRILAGGRLGYEDAATELGLPPGVVGQCRRLTRHLRESGHGEQFTSLLTTLRGTLTEGDPPVNYGERRRVLCDLTQVSMDDWQRFCAEAGWNAGSKLVERRQRWVTAWVWVTLTGGDWHFAPSLDLASLAPAASRLLGNNYRNFINTGTAELLRLPLDNLALRVLRSRRLPGPGHWSPTMP